MQKVLNILKVFLYVLLGANLFFWAAAHGSGHKIPADTNRQFAFTSFVLVVSLIIMFFLKRHSRRQTQE